jgi:cobalt-zinc-cadmium efflux system outer membrane protein
MLAGCSFQTYSPRPIDPAQSASHYRAHDPTGSEFRNYLLTQGYTEDQLPIRQWGLRELTLSALFFHPELDVARARLEATRANEIVAGQRPNPALSGSLGKSQDEVAPWIYSIGLDIPLQTASKRAASIAQAESLTEAARIEIGQSAWLVRNHLLNSWIEYHAALHQTQLLQRELDLRREIVEMLSARLDAGMISSVDLGTARLQLQKSEQALLAEKSRVPQLRAILASSAGLVPETFAQLELDQANIEDLTQRPHSLLLPRTGNDSLQDAALLNRLDIRAALARYAAAESKLRLEIARQYPDIVLSPVYNYEEGFHIWSLGLSALLPLLNKNEGQIAQARALREVEAAQFEALQAQVISEIAQANAAYVAALDRLELARNLQTAQQARMEQLVQQFDDGYSDRLELTTARLEGQLAAQNLIAVEYSVQRAAAALENALQYPLEDVGSMPQNLEQAVRR